MYAYTVQYIIYKLYIIHINKKYDIQSMMHIMYMILHMWYIILYKHIYVYAHIFIHTHTHISPLCETGNAFTLNYKQGERQDFYLEFQHVHLF